MALVLDGSGDITGLTTGALPSNVIGTGAVLQVVSYTTSTVFTSTSTTFADIGMSATITPTSSSSKILIMATFGDTSSQNQSGPAGNKLVLFRNSTQLGGGIAIGTGGNFANQWNYSGAGNEHSISSGSVVFVDSPSSTSALTYKFQGATQTTGRTMEFMRDNTVGTLILMEIA